MAYDDQNEQDETPLYEYVPISQSLIPAIHWCFPKKWSGISTKA